MIQIVILFALLVQIAMTEPPVSGYLPSSRSSQFSKTYAPPAANVSFNFGFSPRTAKGLSGDLPLTKSLGSYSVDNHHDLRSQNSMTASPHSSYGVPSSYDSSTTVPYNYGTPVEDSLPIIEENLVQRRAQDPQIKSSTSGIKSDSVSGKSQFGYAASRLPIENSEVDGKAETYPYDFSYEVMSPESGVALGHHENHDGSSAEGVYHNLLPDGRLLTVEYWADDGGFKPRLSYKTVHSHSNENSGPYRK